jgi:hypothetical protein
LGEALTLSLLSKAEYDLGDFTVLNLTFFLK